MQIIEDKVNEKINEKSDTYKYSYVLKHVWLVGRLSLSGPALCIRKSMLPSPPIGAFVVAAVNFRRFT